MVNWLKKLIKIDKLASLSSDVRKHLKNSNNTYEIEFLESNEKKVRLCLYTDNNLTTLMPNPVVADSGNNFPDIFLREKSYFIKFGIVSGVELHSCAYVNNEAVK